MNLPRVRAVRCTSMRERTEDWVSPRCTSWVINHSGNCQALMPVVWAVGSSGSADGSASSWGSWRLLFDIHAIARLQPQIHAWFHIAHGAVRSKLFISRGFLFEIWIQELIQEPLRPPRFYLILQLPT